MFYSIIMTDNETDTVIEKEVPKKKTLKGLEPPPPKEKKERTPAQIAAFEKARASRASSIKKKEEDTKRLAEYDAMMVKQKLKEKADKIKLKTMKKIETIESISSDEDEVVIEKPKPKPKPEPTKPPPPKPVAKIMPYKFV